jgi:hypothetical protein
MEKRFRVLTFPAISICPRYYLAALLLLVTLVFPAVSQTNELPVISANREIGVSFEPSLIAYREYVGGAIQDSEHGWIPGVGLKASIIRNSLGITNLLLNVSYDFNSGSSNHHSKSLTGGSSLSYDAPFRSNDISFGIGKGFLPTSRFLVAPQVGFEYREWLRKLPEALLAIRENYTFWGPGAALNASYNALHGLVLKARVGAEYTISPTNATIGNPATHVPNLTLALGNRPVWQAELGVDGAITRSVHAFTDIAYSHFGFGKSAIARFGNGGTELEPASVTDLARVRVGLAWCF